jgi:hypothetical protein
MDLTRRAFLKSGAVATAAAGGLGATSSEPPLRVGLVGCGGRGTGAAENVLQAAPNVELVALADAFPERLQKSRKTLSAVEGYKVDDAHCFTDWTPTRSCWSPASTTSCSAPRPRSGPSSSRRRSRPASTCSWRSPSRSTRSASAA